MAPATPHAGCDFSVQYQLMTPIPMQYGVFAEPAGQHSPEAAGLARQELTQLAELLGQAASLSTEDIPEQARDPPCQRVITYALFSREESLLLGFRFDPRPQTPLAN